VLKRRLRYSKQAELRDSSLIVVAFFASVLTHWNKEQRNVVGYLLTNCLIFIDIVFKFYDLDLNVVGIFTLYSCLRYFVQIVVLLILYYLRFSLYNF